MSSQLISLHMLLTPHMLATAWGKRRLQVPSLSLFAQVLSLGSFPHHPDPQLTTEKSHIPQGMAVSLLLDAEDTQQNIVHILFHVAL